MDGKLVKHGGLVMSVNAEDALNEHADRLAAENAALRARVAEVEAEAAALQDAAHEHLMMVERQAGALTSLRTSLAAAEERVRTVVECWNTDREAFIFMHAAFDHEGAPTDENITAGEAVRRCGFTVCQFFTARQSHLDVARAALPVEPRTYTVEWQRPEDPEHQICRGLNSRSFLSRLMRAVERNGSITISRIEPEQKREIKKWGS